MGKQSSREAAQTRLRLPGSLEKQALTRDRGAPVMGGLLASDEDTRHTDDGFS